MKRLRVLSAALALLFLVASVPAVAASDSSEVYFTMINNNAPETLYTATMPFSSNGVIYVPLSTLGKLGVSSANTPSGLQLTSTGDTNVHVVFDVENGTNTTADGGSLNISPIYRYGTYFFPVSTSSDTSGPLALFFGFDFQLIRCEPAPIVRLYNESVSSLSHQTVYQNADQDYNLTEKYNAYISSQNGETSSATTGVSFPITLPDGDTDHIELEPGTNGNSGGNGVDNGEGAAGDDGDSRTTESSATQREVSLNFVHLTAETDQLLDTLDNQNITAGFFVTAQDIQTYPDLVRRIYGEGHQVGIYLAEDAQDEYAAATQALFDAVKLRTLLVAAEDEDVAADADALGLILSGGEIAREFSTDALEDQPGSLILDCGSVAAETLVSVTNTVAGRDFKVTRLVDLIF